MQFLNKTLVLAITFSLLSQNALFAFANETDSTRTPQTLAEYQDRAKQDIEKAPWLSKEGKILLSIGGAAVALMTAQHLIFRHREKVLHQDYKQLLADAHAYRQQISAEAAAKYRALEEATLAQEKAWLEEMSFLQKQLTEVQAEKAALTEQLRVANIKVEGRGKSVTTQKAKLQQAKEAAAAREASLLEDIANLQARFDLKKQHYMDLVRYSPTVEANVIKYERLFDKTITEEEYETLFKRLAKEPWLTSVPSAQQQEFLNIIKNASAYRRGTYKEAGDGFMRYLIRQSLEKNMPLYEHLIGMCRHVYHSKNLIVVGVVVALGLSAQNAQAQHMANRINTNFDLFLNATPEQLTLMEKDPEVRKVCIQGAEALHSLSVLPQEEVEFLQQGLTGQNTPKIPAVNLAR